MDDAAYQLLMMGPVGVPLEEFTDAKPSDSWWEDWEQWTVERIGRRVYTFALDNPADPQP